MSNFRKPVLIVGIILVGVLFIIFVIVPIIQTCFPPTPQPSHKPPPELTRKPILSWISRDGKASLGGSVLLPGKEVWLEEKYYDDAGTQQFEVWRFFDRFTAQLLRSREGWFQDHLPVEHLNVGHARSARLWKVPPPGLPSQAYFAFRDNRGYWSPYLSSSNTVLVSLILPTVGDEFPLLKVRTSTWIHNPVSHCCLGLFIHTVLDEYGCCDTN